MKRLLKLYPCGFSGRTGDGGEVDSEDRGQLTTFPALGRQAANLTHLILRQFCLPVILATLRRLSAFGDAILNILFARAGKHMIRTKTRRIVAAVAKVETLGNGTDHQFISGSVDENVSLADSQAPISETDFGAWPFEASIAFGKILKHGFHQRITAILSWHCRDLLNPACKAAAAFARCAALIMLSLFVTENKGLSQFSNATRIQGRNVAPTAPTNTQVLAWDSATSTWKPAAASGGGAPPFSAVTAGTNATALVMGTGGSLTISGSGTINATSLGTMTTINGLTNVINMGAGTDIFGDPVPNATNRFSVFSETVDTTVTAAFIPIQAEVALKGAGGVATGWDDVWAFSAIVNSKSDSTGYLHLIKGGNYTVDHYGSGVIVNRISGFEADVHNESSNSPSGTVNGLQFAAENNGGQLLQMRGVNALVNLGGGAVPSIDGYRVKFSLYGDVASTSTNVAAFHAETVDDFGTPSTVTNFYQFKAEEATIGTNNFGFHSNLSAATGRWAFYGAGTAASLLGGALTVSDLATTGAATGKTIVCADTNGKLYRSSSAVTCAN